MLAVKLLYSSQMDQPLWDKSVGSKFFRTLFSITPTNVDSPGNANPYVTGGDTLDLTQLFNTASSAPGMLLPTFEQVVLVRILSQGATSPGAATDYIYRYNQGSALNNGTMQVFTSATAQTGNAELAAGNYPAGVLADTIIAEALFVMP